MKSTQAKILLILLIALSLSGCNAVKRVPEGKNLLKDQRFVVDGKVDKRDDWENIALQQPNVSLIGFPLRLHLYNLAKDNPDSSYAKSVLNNPKRYKRLSGLLSEKQVHRMGQSFAFSGIHRMLKRTGEAPVIWDSLRTARTTTRIKGHYFNQGYFNSEVTATQDSIGKKRIRQTYAINLGPQYVLDSITREVSTPVLDTLFAQNEKASLLEKGNPFKASDYDAEKERITTHFRNNGIFHFQQNFIRYEIDTINTGHKAYSHMIIEPYTYRQNDTMKTEPFTQFRISRVNVYTDLMNSNKNLPVMRDSVTYNNIHLYSINKLKYRPKAITDPIFIQPGGLFADYRTTLTSRFLSNLKVFNYPTISYDVDPDDPNKESLIANIYLVPREKYSFGATLDFTHSSIQEFGIAASTYVSIRNVFNGAETLDISAKGNIGSSNDFANPNNIFFNVSEYGVDMKLSFPRVLSPIGTDKFIPKSMIPSTSISWGYARQTNIGLDKENFTGTFTYNWTPKRLHTSRFDLINMQYIKNLNIGNYFSVYRTSFDALNHLAQTYAPGDPNYFFNGSEVLDRNQGALAFMQDGLAGNNNLQLAEDDFDQLRSIDERRNRLTENNLIVSSSYSYSMTDKADINDREFYLFRTKVESAGLFMSLLSNMTKQLETLSGTHTIFNIEYSQYLKGEVEYIKHWDLRRKRVFAIRGFAGVAIPYGNSNSIPFSRSYFGGGSNDNRGWQSYGLGPGSSGGINDFNEANMKLSFSAELRFNMFGDLNGAVFVDAGNIWNVMDNITDDDYTFDGLEDLKKISVGSGFGFRYDFQFFILRADLGFKTFNPADPKGDRWFRNYNFANSVVNIGINYPF